MTAPNSPAQPLEHLRIKQHRIALITPFTFKLKDPAHLKLLDGRVLASDPALAAAGLMPTAAAAAHAADGESGDAQPRAPRRWRRYAGARNDTVGAVNPAYHSLYPQAQQVVHNPLDSVQEDAASCGADLLLCLPYSLPLDGLSLPNAQAGAGGDAPCAAPRLHSARLLLFRTGIGMLVLLLDMGAGDLPATRLLDAVRCLSEPQACDAGQTGALAARQLDDLAGRLLRSTLGDGAHLHLRRKTWACAAHAPDAQHADVQRLALLLSHRQTAAYALLPEQAQDAVYTPFAYVAHAVSVGGAASVVGDDPGAQIFVDMFIHRVWSHTYLPLLLLPLHQHYFFLRHAEWEPLSPRAHAAVHRLEERFEDNLDFQAHFGSALVGQVDLHNAYVRAATQHLRLHERAQDYERATRDYAGMLRARRQGKLRWIEIFGSAGAVFLIVRELLDALMQNGFFWEVPESRAWFALLQRWSPEKTTEMIERIHHWDQATLVLSLGAALLAGVLAWLFDRRISKE